MANSIIEMLTRAIEKGKVKGYEDLKKIKGEDCFIQYAIKKSDGVYHAYFFCVPEKKMDVIEDYATEELNSFSDIKEAFAYLTQKGAEIKRFSAIKGTLPF